MSEMNVEAQLVEDKETRSAPEYQSDQEGVTTAFTSTPH